MNVAASACTRHQALGLRVAGCLLAATALALAGAPAAAGEAVWNEHPHFAITLGLVALILVLAAAFVLTRRRLHRARSDFAAFQKAILDSLPERLAVLDPDGRVAVFNAAWRGLPPSSGIELEYRTGQWSLRSVCGLDPTSDEGAVVARAINEVASGLRGACDIEYPCTTPEGRLWFALQGRRFLFRDRPHVLLIQSDITLRKGSEQRLRESQEKFARAFHSVPIGVVVTTREEGRFLEVNDAFERITGFDRAGLVGRTAEQTGLLAEAKRRRINERLQQEGRIEGLECLMHTKTRGAVPIRYFGEAIEVGGEPCILSVVEDISIQAQAIRQLAASEEKFRTLVQNVTGAVYRRALDEAGTLEFLSEGIEALTGQRAHSFIGPEARPFAEIIHPDDRESVLATIRAAVDAGQPYCLEYRIHHADGTTRWIGERGCGVPGETGQPGRADGVLFDVTAARADQAALVQAREAADAANRAKSAFLANMSHELRTPLNAIMGYAQILQRDPTLQAGQHLAADTIQRSCDHLLLLISDILDLAKIEAGRFELIPTSCHLEGFFNTLCQMFRIRAEQKGIAFHHRPLTALPRRVALDEKRLRQVVMNLLGNAVKFTEHGAVSLETAYEGQRLIISVADTGIGIAPDKIGEIFQPFHQAGNERYRAQGTGLGLAISRQLVQAMGGDIAVTSEFGRGSRFSAVIPVIEEESPGRALEPARPAIPRIEGYRRTDGQPGPLRILVVDDAPVNRLVLRELLGPYGFEIAEAESGEAGIERALEWRPDFIFMDVVLPGISGHQATRIIQQRYEGAPPVIAAWSSSAFAEDIEASLDAGCCLHLTKPVRLETLLKALEGNLPIEWICPGGDAGAPAQPSKGEPLGDATMSRLIRIHQRGDLILLRKEVENQLDTQPGHPVLSSLLDAARRFDLRAVRRILTPPLN